MQSAKYRLWVVFLLFLGSIINAVDRASLSTVTPYIMKELNISAGLMGIVLSAFFWAYVTMNIPGGGLADKYGAKKVLGWSAVLWSVCSALTGRVTIFWHLLLTRIGVGAGEAAIFPIYVKIVNNNFPTEERATVTGCYSSGLRLGFALTPGLMAVLMVNYNWRKAFYITGIGSLLWVVLWYFTFREVREERPVKAEEPKIPWVVLLRHRTVVGIVLCKFFQDYLYYLFVSWLPAYLIMERRFTIMKMGLYASLPWLTGSIAQPFIGWVSDWLIRRGVSTTISRKSIMITMQCLAASAVFAAYAKDPMVAVWLLTLSVACESAATALLWAVCTEVAPPHAAGALGGIMNTGGAIAGVLAPTLTGILLQFTGNFQKSLLLGSLMILIAAFCMLFVVREISPISQEHYSV